MALNDDIALLSMVPLFSDISEDKLRLIAFGAERRKMQAQPRLSALHDEKPAENRERHG